MTTQLATLGGGCFWCLEAAFKRLQGVTSVVSGYAGGHIENPDYYSVCDGNTGHAEVIQISYDSSQIDFPTLLQVFFAIHDPTTLNRQGADVGTQYRSIILCHDDQQKQQAQAIIEDLNRQGIWDRPLVTEICNLHTFYPAENYHQDYYQRNPDNRYCNVVIPPKLEKLERYFQARLKKVEDNA